MRLEPSNVIAPLYEPAEDGDGEVGEVAVSRTVSRMSPANASASRRFSVPRTSVR